MTESLQKISYDEFLKYRFVNTEMHPELVEFYNNNKTKFGRNHGHPATWRKFENKIADNWLINNKFKQNDEEKLYSQFRSILNKLSDGNFDSLAKELTTVEINKANHLAKLTELIFNKAIIESKFANMYAKLAKELSVYSVKEDEKTFYFRELLIGRCQLMFNECVLLDATEQNKTMLTREMAIGCMTFIGELYLCELLSNKIINSCFLLLLMKVGQNKSHIIDCICTLMKVTGKTFVLKCQNEAKIIFDKVEKTISSGTLNNKDKFALMDLMDLKKTNKW
jgi:hypothetical protein